MGVCSEAEDVFPDDTTGPCFQFLIKSGTFVSTCMCVLFWSLRVFVVRVYSPCLFVVLGLNVQILVLPISFSYYPITTLSWSVELDQLINYRSLVEPIHTCRNNNFKNKMCRDDNLLK